MEKKNYTTRSKKDKNDFAIFEISSFPDQPHTHARAYESYKSFLRTV